MERYQEQYQMWLAYEEMDPELRQELEAIENDPNEIRERFYQDLVFGTGGLRGILGAGTNRMNIYTIVRASAGLALYLLAEYGQSALEKGVVIAYDSRRYSREFAETAALTLNSYGIRSYVFDRLTPTPELSFAVQHLKAMAGIVVTASHNPKEYNGYKVYDRYGCQIIDAAAQAIQGYMEQFANLYTLPLLLDRNHAEQQGLLQTIGNEVHQAFQAAVLQQAALEEDAMKAGLKVIYTPLHGTGLLPVTGVLQKAGFTDVSVLDCQREPDADFSTVRSPNPEEKDALKLAIFMAQEDGADLVLGTDPDCDRVGIAVRRDGDYQLLTGNQVGALLADYVIMTRREQMDERATLIKTIVTSELGANIARANGWKVLDTLTGFKYIGNQMIRFDQEGHREHVFVMGYEESYGYLIGTHARDKDAVVASLLICEMAAYHKVLGKTLLDRLQELYQQYGYYLDALDSFTLPGADGQARIQKIMEQFRSQNTTELAGLAVVDMLDYQKGIQSLPKANVLKYCFEDGGWLAIRPSGTEPKIKVYYSLVGADQNAAQEKLQGLQAMMKRAIQPEG